MSAMTGVVTYVGPKARWTTGIGAGVVISTEANPPTATVQWSYIKFPKKQFVHKVPLEHIEQGYSERNIGNGTSAEETE